MCTHLIKTGQALQQEAMDFGGWDWRTSVSGPNWGSTCHILFTDTERQGHDCCSSWFLVLFSLFPLLLLLENGTEISRTEPHRFLYLIRSNPYFLVRLYRFRFRISDVSYFKCKSRKRFRYFSTVFYFSTFNLKYSELKIRFKPNLANCTGQTAQLQAAHHAAAFFLLVASCSLL